MFSGKLKKVKGKLIYISQKDNILYQQFKDSVDENHIIDVYMEVNSGTGSLAQLAKLHKLIRILADESGTSFEGMKMAIKDKSGLIIKRKAFDKEYINWKSFGDCSKEELGLAIQSCIEIGDLIGVNVR
jgi:hypothetical protein